MIEEFAQCSIATTPTARKPHKCGECHGEIKPGEKYHYTSGIIDGRPFATKQCVDCVTLIGELDEGVKDPHDRTAIGELLDGIDASGSNQLLSKYVAIRVKRGARVFEWMTKRLNNADKQYDNTK